LQSTINFVECPEPHGFCSGLLSFRYRAHEIADVADLFDLRRHCDDFAYLAGWQDGPQQRVAIDEWGTERLFMKPVTCNLLLFGAPHNDAGRRLAVGRRRET